MKAIRFGLLGSPLGGLSSSSGQEIRKPWILEACNRELAAQGQYGFEVRFDVSLDGEEWELIRSASLRRQVLTPTSDADFELDVRLRRGGHIPGPDEREELLLRMMPPEISRFFLFDGELLNQYAELLDNESEIGRRISSSIEQILGVPVLKTAREHLSALTERLDREVGIEASKDQQTQQLGTALTQAIEMRTAHEAELAGQREELDRLNLERESLEALLRSQDLYQKAIDRLDQARTDLEYARLTQREKRTELQAAMKDAWRTALAETVATARARSSQAVASALSNLATSLRSRAVEAHHCEICDQDLVGHARDRVAMSLPATALTGDANAAALQAIGHMEDIERFRVVDIRSDVRFITNQLDNARIDEIDARSRITDAEQSLEGQSQDDLRGTIAAYGPTMQKIAILQSAIDASVKKIDEQVAAIDGLTKALSAVGATTFGDLQARLAVVREARDVYRMAVELYKSALRERVEASASELFLTMTTEPTDYARLAINDHYGLSIIHADGAVETGRSAGQEQVVALALMGALQANAPLRGPIVMDTPFGRLDPKHTANVVQTLPSMAEQVVLFVQEDEIDRPDVRRYLGHALKREYELQRVSSRSTRVSVVDGR